MLTRRPLICLAAAYIAGALLTRQYPEFAVWRTVAWLGAAAAFIALLRIPAAQAPQSIAPIPAASPGWIASRSGNLFVLGCCSLSLCLGSIRQESSVAWKDVSLPEFFQADMTVDSLPDQILAGAKLGYWTTAVTLRRVNGEQAGDIPALLSGPAGKVFRRGDLIRARVENRRIRKADFPGAFSEARWMETSGLALSLRVVGGKTNGYGVVAIDDPSLTTAILRKIDYVRSRAIQSLVAGGSEEGGLLAAMLYGYMGGISRETRDSFGRTGVGHVLAISGLHVGLVAGLMWYVTGLFSLERRWRAGLCLLLVLVYLGLSGARVAAMRAGVMAAIHLCGIILGRKEDLLNSLAAAALLLSWLVPSASLALGFQLSFAAVFFIGVCWREFGRHFRPLGRAGGKGGFPSRIRRDLLQLLLMSAAAWFGNFPIVAGIFNQVNLIGLFLNLLVIPLMSLVLAGGLLSPWLFWLPYGNDVAAIPTMALAWLVRLAEQVPWAYLPVAPPASGWVAAYYFVFAAWAARKLFPEIWRRAAGRMLLLFLALSMAGISWSMTALPPPPGGRLSLLPTGKGDVLVAESSDGAIVIAGYFSKDGRDEARWLHYLRRNHPVVALSADGGRLSVLNVNQGVSRIIDMSAKGRETNGWQPVPGAPDIKWAGGTDDQGRPSWWALAVDGKTAAAAAMSAARFKVINGLHLDGFESSMFSWSPRGRIPGELPARKMPTGLAGRKRPAYPPEWFWRSGFGALLDVGGGWSGYNGTEWKKLDREPLED